MDISKNVKDIITEYLPAVGIDSFGFCSYKDCLPLISCRAISRLPSSPRSIIAVLLPYYIGEYAQRNVARYSIVQDYHTVAGEILTGLCDKLLLAFPLEQFVPFVDNSPIREVFAACNAGLGVVGKNTQLINSQYGSNVFIGSIVTSILLPSNLPKTKACLGCGRCIAACPTGAISKNSFDKSLCRSHITQKKDTLSAWEKQQIALGGFVWGCDICTDICPMNKSTRKTSITQFYVNPVPILTADLIDELLPQKAYGYRGKDLLLRNLLIIGVEGLGNINPKAVCGV